VAELTAINTLTLGNTFGTWYARTNDIIRRLNVLKTASITGGDGIVVSAQSAKDGGFTVSVSDTITKNMTFNGNVTILGSLNAGFSQDITGINVTVPKNTGVTFGNIVYIDSGGLAQKAKADDECTSEVVGVVIGFTGGQAQVATTGKVSGSNIISNFLGTVGATLQKGVVYFLSEGISGAGTTLEPNVSQYVSKPVLLGLTGDTGLILPYRGYIGLTAASSSSSATVNATSGVLSINGITAALWETGVPQTIANLKQTGHLCGVNYFQIAGSTTKLSKILQLNIESGFDTEYPDERGGINAIKQYQSITESTSGQTKKITKKWITNPDDGFLFATSGITADVYKITKIKIIPRKANTITFSLQKEYNAYAGTTAISSSVAGPIKDPHALRIELRRNGYAIAGNYITVGSPALQYTSETPSSSIIEQDIHPIRFTPLTGEVFTVGITAGNIAGTENVNGSFPITQVNGVRSRCSTYNINNVILGGIGSDASKYMKASNECIYYDNTTYITGAEGYTLESAILGWNAQYGAVSESLYFNPVSVINGISDGQANALVTNLDILLELYKYDTNTKTTTGNVIIVSSKYSIYNHSVEYSGAAVNSTYTIP
jgi:hypothetical protein